MVKFLQSGIFFAASIAVLVGASIAIGFHYIGWHKSDDKNARISSPQAQGLEGTTPQDAIRKPTADGSVTAQTVLSPEGRMDVRNELFEELQKIRKAFGKSTPCVDNEVRQNIFSGLCFEYGLVKEQNLEKAKNYYQEAKDKD